MPERRIDHLGNVCKSILKVQLFKILITTCVALSACGSNSYYAPVRDQAQPPSRKITHHVVSKGETLYSIAWRYNLDYKGLARVNRIGRNYRIYPGQRLLLRDGGGLVPKRAHASSRKTSVTKPAIRPTPKAVAPKVASRSIKATPRPAPPRPKVKAKAPARWIWPAQGSVVSRFSDNKGLNKGIDIKGDLEEPVLAAAAGKVVYSGEGLRGYGKLLIVKHSDKFLSAYAHNHRLLAREGQAVNQGQKIAEMGASGTDSVKLHFEIRFDGKPVDPLRYLPAR